MPESVYTEAEVDEKLAALITSQASLEGILLAHDERLGALESGLPLPDPDPPSARFPGDPAVGTAYWGCTQDNNAEPTAHEQATGLPIGVRRTFFQWDERKTKLANVLDQDSAAGRLSWVSLKTDGQSSKPQFQIDELYAVLDQTNPVWLSIWHEPENDSIDPAEWRSLQSLFGDRPSNVAFGPTLMAATYRISTGRDPEEWWVDGIYDFLGVDHYAKKVGVPLVSTFQWDKALEFATVKNVPLAVGEWGTKTTGSEGAQFIRDFWNDGLEHGVVAFSCYDSSGGQDGPWNLSKISPTLEAEFRAIMGDERGARI